MLERQELYCHDCERYVQFNIDTSLNGNHVLTCPNCGREHCRVVKDGIITDDRWDSRNQTFSITGSITFSSTSAYTITDVTSTTTTADYFITAAWTNSVTVAAY